MQAQPSSDDLENSAGLTYVIAYPDTTMNTFDARFPNNRFADKIYAFVYSAVENKMSIRGNGYNRPSIIIPAGQFKIIELTDPAYRAPQPIVTESGVVNRNTFRIDADAPIVVYCYMVTKFGTEAWTPIPIDSWGTEYYAAAVPAEIAADVSPGGEFDYNRKNKMAPSEILVIAAYDDTKISIVPNGALHNFPAVTNVSLNAGEAYQVQSYVDTSIFNDGTQPDLGGSYIFATKPVGVVTGNTRAQVIDRQEGLGKNIFKNMLIEWITPIEQHGTKFVYMPTMDARRPLDNGSNINESRKAEWVRVYGTRPGTTRGSSYDGSSAPKTYTIQQRKFYQQDIGVPNAVYFETDKPAQAFMNSTAVVKFNGTTNGFGGYIGAQFDGWGAYMVEMTPREQWVNFAPYYASVHPPGMEHFINVVTDTNSRSKIRMEDGAAFSFTKPIPGTDLIWGSMTVTPGRDHYLKGDGGAKFYAFVYGMYKGHEEYRPGKSKKDDDDPTTLANRDKGTKDPELLHPSEYEEYLAVAYGYPLAPTRLVIGTGDSLIIDTTMNCTDLTVNIRTFNQNPVGLRSIRLDSAVNARIVSLEPQPVTGKSTAKLVVRPIDDSKDASAVILIQDRTGKKTRIKYVYFAERATLVPNPPKALDFGSMTPNTSDVKEITLTNPLERDLNVEEIKLVLGNQDFTIVGSTPAAPAVLKPGETIRIQVRANPTREGRNYLDSVRIQLGCRRYTVPVIAATLVPRIYVGDLDFGTLGKGVSKTLKLNICNTGDGYVTFDNPSGDAVVQWLLDNFSVTQRDIEMIMASKIPGDSCITIDVTFVSDETGNFRTVARFWGNTRETRDTSVWTAKVTQPGPQITDYNWGNQWEVSWPSNCTKNTLPYFGPDTIVVHNSGTSDFEIVSSDIVRSPDANWTTDDSRHFVKDMSQDAFTIKPGTRVRAGDSATNAIYQLVQFLPEDERPYWAALQVVVKDLSTNTLDTIYGNLRGVGIQSHIDITDNDFGTIQFTGAGSTQIPGKVTISARQSRATTITGITIGGVDAAQFTIEGPQPLPSPTSPWVLQPGETRDVDLMFRPTSPDVKNATINLEGDFSCESDSVGTLVGTSFTLGATTTDLDFGDLLRCNEGDGQVTITNNGTAPMVIRNINLNLPDGVTATNFPTLPLTLQGNESFNLLLHFSPTIVGAVNGQVEWTVESLDGTPITADPSLIRGNAHDVLAHARIDTGHAAFPGTTLTIPVHLLDNNLDPADVTDFDLTIYYSKEFMSAMVNGADASKLAELLKGTLLEGWTITVLDAQPDKIAFNLKAPQGSSLKGSGVLIRVPFLTFIGSKDNDSLRLSMSLNNVPCADVVETPGHARLEGVCGLNFRLIEAFASKYALPQNKPNPFNPTTDIEFSLGLDGPTTLVVYNSVGEKVATLVDGFLQPGTYTVSWDATDFPSGLYYYRLTSGDWSQTNTMLLNK